MHRITSNLNSSSESKVVTITGKDLSDFFRRNGILNMYATGRNSGQFNKLKKGITHTQTMETRHIFRGYVGRALHNLYVALLR